MAKCPVSCKVCESTCEDAHEGCPSWASMGECANNTAWMYQNCPAACSVCSESACHDKEEQCAEWAEAGQCIENPAFMHRECSESCGICVDTCKDRHDSCAAWAADKACEENKLFMLRNCAPRAVPRRQAPTPASSHASLAHARTWLKMPSRASYMVAQALPHVEFATKSTAAQSRTSSDASLRAHHPRSRGAGGSNEVERWKVDLAKDTAPCPWHWRVQDLRVKAILGTSGR